MKVPNFVKTIIKIFSPTYIAEKSVCKKFQSRVTNIDNHQKFLIQKLGELHNHINHLYGMMNNSGELPDANGHVRMHQLACVQYAKQACSVLRRANIPFFLGHETLLDVAHGGKMLPWTISINLCLMRPDYNRAITVLSQQYNHHFFSTTKSTLDGAFQLCFLGRPCIKLFPMDTYYERPKDSDAFKLFTKNYKAAMKMARAMEYGESEYTEYSDIINDIIMQGRAPDPNGDIFQGIDWQSQLERDFNRYHPEIWRNEWVFPLRNIEFCGHVFPAPNNIDAWLTTKYGNWETLTPDFTHSTHLRYTYEELDILQAFINGIIK